MSLLGLRETSDLPKSGTVDGDPINHTDGLPLGDASSKPLRGEGSDDSVIAVQDSDGVGGEVVDDSSHDYTPSSHL